MHYRIPLTTEDIGRNCPVFLLHIRSQYIVNYLCLKCENKSFSGHFSIYFLNVISVTLAFLSGMSAYHVKWTQIITKRTIAVRNNWTFGRPNGRRSMWMFSRSLFGSPKFFTRRSVV